MSTSAFGRIRPDGATLATAAGVLLAEGVLVMAYLSLARPRITQPLLVVLVPFVWLNLSLWVFARVRPAAGDARRLPAALLAVGYFALLAVLGGLVMGGGSGAAGLRVQFAGFPGWVPLLVYDGALVNLVVIPFKLVGYLALTYLVYVTAVDATGAILGGVVGLFACVSCTFPLLAGLVASLTGGAGAAAAVVYGNSYLLSTVVFAVTVAILAWRPTPAALGRLRRRLAR